MKVILTALNAKYIHSSLALRYLEKYCRENKTDDVDYSIMVREFSINEPLDVIMAEIYKTGAGVVAFSCYIWNRDLTFELAERIKKVSPEKEIVMGGPEVSYNSREIMKKNKYIDYIIKGEGELTLKALLDYLNKNKERKINEIKGIVYRREDGAVAENEDRPLLKNLDSIPEPYTAEELEEMKNKLIYYETSRGCPFNCSYCLSSTIKGIRAFSMDRIKKDLLLFIENGVKQVKFVDRTFNTDKKRALEIFRFLVRNRHETSFHFEITADLLDREMIEYLKTVPSGLFRFEIGVQSTSEKTLKLVNRQMDFGKLAENARQLREESNINIHLDLIAGLPGEDYNTFQKSFNDVYSLNPQVLQLGFLKLIPGTKIRREADGYNYQFTTRPPYEVLKNKDISYPELLKLKEIAYLVDKYHNSGVFTNSLAYIFTGHYHSYFKFFEEFSLYFSKKGLNRLSHSRKALYGILFDFFDKKFEKEDLYYFREYLKLDLLLYNQGVKLPSWASKIENPAFNDLRYNFLSNNENINKYLPAYRSERVGDILKKVRFEIFNFNVLDKTGEDLQEKRTVILFDYGQGGKTAVSNVSEWFKQLF